jgi:hypothetical protein
MIFFLKNNKKYILNGGNGLTVPLYKEPKNSPFVPNEQKNIYTDRIIETVGPQVQQPQGQYNVGNIQKPSKQPEPLLNLQLYQQQKPKQPQSMAFDPYTINPIAMPTPFFPPQFSYPYGQGAHPLQPINVIKQYNINSVGPTGDHITANIVYEDAMPTKQFNTTFNTLGERLTLNSFIKNTLFNKGNGTDITLDGTGDNSLISFIKFMDLNPYNSYKFSKNPYKGMPKDMLWYRSCYPIRHDPQGGSVTCAKDSVGVSIRIYKLTTGEYMVNKQNHKNYLDYETWREIAYYEFINNQIIRNKICPNFINMYGFYIAEKCNIDFDKIAQIRGDDIINQPQYLSNVPSLQMRFEPMNNQNGGNLNPNMMNDVTMTLNPDAYNNKALVILTESPNYSLTGWASRLYQKDNNIGRMINSGFHTDKIWQSIMFQLMAALYCLQINNIFYNNFSLEDNVYIKDIASTSNVTSYWKYKINGIDYYIPNYGYIVLLDSSFKDIESDNNLIIKNNVNKHKIYCDLLKPDNEAPLTDKQIKDECYNMMKKCFTINAFDNSFIQNGGCRPPPDTMSWLSNIEKHNGSSNIGDCIFQYMGQFLNNRIGTYLKELEITNIRRDGIPSFVKGDIVVYEESNNIYRFVMYIETDTNGQAKILTKSNPTSNDILPDNVPETSLFNYSKVEPIVQNFKPNESNMNEEDILETYILNEK